MAHLPGCYLIDGDTGAVIGTPGLADADAGEKAAGSAGMVAAAVAARISARMVESAQDLDLVFEALQGLKRAGDLEIATLRCRPPVSRQGPLAK